MSNEECAKAVLICDDEIDLVTELGDLFVAFGWETVISHTYAEAIAVLMEGMPVNCLLTDRAMPGGSGDDLIALALCLPVQRRPKVLVLMTGVPDLRANSSEALADLIVEKPFDPASLQERMTLLLHRNHRE
jgi:DNA-binding response OmpR family regulator